MTNDTYQANKAVQIKGTTSITASLTSGNETNRHIVFNDITLYNGPSKDGFALSFTGQGCSVGLKNVLIVQEFTTKASFNIAATHNSARVYMENTVVVQQQPMQLISAEVRSGNSTVVVLQPREQDMPSISQASMHG
jgi:hypothetical protein